MKSLEFSKYLEKLEITSKRLEITTLLAELFEKLPQEQVRLGIYLSTGLLKAKFENPKFNIADKMMIRILEQAYSTPKNVVTATQINNMYRVSGDLGNVAQELADSTTRQQVDLTYLYEELLKIANLSGSGSQDSKVKNTAILLNKLDSLSAKYTVRIILGTTRLGFTELTVIAAIAEALGNKQLSHTIEQVYSVHPDLGKIAYILKSEGMKGLKKLGIEPGVPILSQKPQRLSGPEEAMEKMGNVWAEFKFDGTRVQLHMDKNKQNVSMDNTQESLFGRDNVSKCLVSTYTRNLEQTTHQYPDIVEGAKTQIKADSVILDGEAIGFDKKTGAFLPFQETIQRKRKHGISDSALEIPLKYYVFDILYLNGESLIEKPLSERRKCLEKVVSAGDVIKLSEYIQTNDLDELTDYYTFAKNKRLEGLVLKTPSDPYQAGARSFSWVKLKKADQKLLDDSIDVVVLGYFAGKGVRSKFGIGGFLVGILDETDDTFKTITKIGTGLNEEDWIFLKKLCDKNLVNKLPSNVIVEKSLMPDYIVKPKIVVEVGADEISISPMHSAKYALRFPRLIKFRQDKDATDATTLKEVVTMFKRQRTQKS